MLAYIRAAARTLIHVTIKKVLWKATRALHAHVVVRSIHKTHSMYTALHAGSGHWLAVGDQIIKSALEQRKWLMAYFRIRAYACAGQTPLHQLPPQSAAGARSNLSIFKYNYRLLTLRIDSTECCPADITVSFTLLLLCSHFFGTALC